MAVANGNGSASTLGLQLEVGLAGGASRGPSETHEFCYELRASLQR